MASKTDQLVADYLKHLDAELRDLPRQRRREIVEDVSGHIAEARADLDGEGEAEIRTLLDRLGEPAEIASEARERFGVRPKASGWKEIGALILLPIGGIVLPIFGWVVGVLLLWISDAWSTRDKVIGTLLFPGGLLLPLGLGLVAEEGGACGSVVNPRLSPQPIGDACQSPGGTEVWEIALIATLVLVPIVVTIYLARRLRQVSVVAA